MYSLIVNLSAYIAKESQMKAEVVAIVSDLKRVKVEQVIFEAITNSIHAQATSVEISINSLNRDLDDTDFQSVNEICIVDNGQGFTVGNIDSFQIYRSPHKKHLGAKGIGRFLYLKLFQRVRILSLDKEIHFNFEDDVKVNEASTVSEKTYVYLSSANEDLRVKKALLVRDIKLHFLPLFKLNKDSGSSPAIEIKIIFNGIEFDIIHSDDIPDFYDDTFQLDEHVFHISYLLNHNDYQSGDGAYCADGRVVSFNSQMEAKKQFKAFKGVDFFYLLSSTYFDRHLNDERDELLINPKLKRQKDSFTPLSWEEIYQGLGKKIKAICLEHGINVAEQSQEYLAKAIEEAPYLASYFESNDLMLPAEDLRKKAQKAFNDDKDRIRGNNSRITASDKMLILNRVVQAELAEYVFDRQKTIEKLKMLTSSKALEKEIHDLFIKRYTKDDIGDFRSNNLWLFDDRFMTYDKVFSDKQIKEIFPDLYQQLDKPNILSISSNTFDKNHITEIVIIELKRPEIQNGVAIAEAELLKYSRFARGSNLKNIRIWTYAFIQFDENVDLELGDKGYNRIPVHNGWSIRYRYYDTVNTIINFIDYRALAVDAESRNNTFLNILKAKHYDDLPN